MESVSILFLNFLFKSWTDRQTTYFNVFDQSERADYVTQISSNVFVKFWAILINYVYDWQHASESMHARDVVNDLFLYFVKDRNDEMFFVTLLDYYVGTKTPFILREIIKE